MPEYWYNKYDRVIPDDDRKELNKRIAATKKPKFMIYVYETGRRKYHEFVTNTNDRCLIQFGKTVKELTDNEHKTEAEKEFLYWYNEFCPVGPSLCTVNRICEYFESEFSRGSVKEIYGQFDYSILKSDRNPPKTTYDKVVEIYNQYVLRVTNYHLRLAEEPINKDDASLMRSQMDSNFRIMCAKVCPDEEELCNIVLDICYTTDKSKRFAWAICGEQIIKNLLRRNSNTINYPVLSDDGDFEFCGNRFKMEQVRVSDDE